MISRQSRGCGGSQIQACQDPTQSEEIVCSRHEFEHFLIIVEAYTCGKKWLERLAEDFDGYNSLLERTTTSPVCSKRSIAGARVLKHGIKQTSQELLHEPDFSTRNCSFDPDADKRTGRRHKPKKQHPIALSS